MTKGINREYCPKHDNIMMEYMVKDEKSGEMCWFCPECGVWYPQSYIFGPVVRDGFDWSSVIILCFLIGFVVLLWCLFKWLF